MVGGGSVPFGKYSNFQDCVNQNRDKSNPEAYCAALHHKITGKWPAEKSFNPDLLISIFKIAFKIGGPGSGNFGHAGRPGLVGGSAPRSGGMDRLSRDMYGTTPSRNRIAINVSDAKFKKCVKNLLGKEMTPKRLCKEAGIPGDMKTVQLYVNNNNDLNIEASFGKYIDGIMLSISKTPDGINLDCGYVRKHSNAPPGMGKRHAAKQLQFANKYNMSLSFLAGEGYNMNGYYTWASFGADGEAPPRVTHIIKRDHPDFYNKMSDSFGGLKVQDIFNAPKIGNLTGKEWWKKNGGAFNCSINSETVKNAYQWNKYDMESQGVYVGKSKYNENEKSISLKKSEEFKRPDDIIPGEGTNLFADDLNYATDEEIERLENWLKANGYWIGQPKRFNRG